MLKTWVNALYKLAKLDVLDNLYDLAKKQTSRSVLFEKKLKIPMISNKAFRSYFTNNALSSNNFELAAQYLTSSWPVDQNKADNLYNQAKMQLHLPANITYIKAYNNRMRGQKFFKTKPFSGVEFK